MEFIIKALFKSPNKNSMSKFIGFNWRSVENSPIFHPIKQLIYVYVKEFSCFYFIIVSMVD